MSSRKSHGYSFHESQHCTCEKQVMKGRWKVEPKLTRSRRPDARLFKYIGDGMWISNRRYKTRKGAEVFEYQIRRHEEVRRGITYHTEEYGNGFAVVAVQKEGV